MVEQVFSFCVKITVLYECGTTKVLLPEEELLVALEPSM
ncbi:hypothetical protein BREVNS_0115 [Brevinematales bacterium NS]|nr:hypothetical protein BREVNS_0115 [Brevinematales bacterium NS]